MASIMRARFSAQPTGYAHPALLQTFWRPGTSGGSTADATDVLARVRACLFAARTYFGTTCTWHASTEVDVLEDLTGAITGTFVGADPTDVTGSATLDSLSPALATLIKANTSLIVGRRFLKGRLFLAGPTEAMSGPAGYPTIAPATLEAAFNAMLTGGSTASFPVIWHRPNPAGSSTGTSGPVISYQMQTSYWGTQRRRRF